MGISFWLAFFLGFLPLLIFGIILCLGYGKDLIAGYNTMSENQRKNYDEKRMMRITGSTLIIMSILLVALFYLLDLQIVNEWILTIILFLPLIICIPIINSRYVKHN